MEQGNPSSTIHLYVYARSVVRTLLSIRLRWRDKCTFIGDKLASHTTSSQFSGPVVDRLLVAYE